MSFSLCPRCNRVDDGANGKYLNADLDHTNCKPDPEHDKHLEELYEQKQRRLKARKEAFQTKEERNEFTIEQLKYSVLSDLHHLSAKLGHIAAREWVEKEWKSLAF